MNDPGRQLFPTKLYPITDVRLARASHAAQVALLADGGAGLIQLREKNLAAGIFYEEARKALQIAIERGAEIIINDRVDIALALGTAGVHLGQDDIPPEAARRLLGDRAIIGLSTHSIEQARLAASQPVDYVAFGPIFTTTTKPGRPAVGLDALREVRRIVAVPLVAIGGLTRENARAAVDAGADAVAVIADLLAEPEHITVRVRAFLAAL